MIKKITFYLVAFSKRNLNYFFCEFVNANHTYTHTHDTQWIPHRIQLHLQFICNYNLHFLKR